jgi:molecular chaperone HtpG
VFWKDFGRVLKEGVYHDSEWRERLAGLLRYESSRGEGMTGCRTTCSGCRPSRRRSTTSRPRTSRPRVRARTSKALQEGLRGPLHDRHDRRWVVDALREYSGKPFTSAAKGALDLPESEDDKKKRKSSRRTLSTVIDKLKQALAAHVKEVRVTDRLTDSPACLVSDEYGMSARQERILREAGHALPEMKRTLELNPEHAVVKKLQAMTDEARFADWSSLLYDQALLAEGALPADPGAFAKKVAQLMADG